MIHPEIFTTIHLRTMRARNQTKDIYNFVPYVHALVPLRVLLRLSHIVDTQEFVFPYSYERQFQIVSFVILFLLLLY